MSIRGLDSATGQIASDALREAGRQSSVSFPREADQARGTAGVAQMGFSDILGGVVEEAAQRSQVADAKADAFARGALDDVHGTMIATKEADISMKLVGSIRNKLLDAFQELWRTNV